MIKATDTVYWLDDDLNLNVTSAQEFVDECGETITTPYGVCAKDFYDAENGCISYWCFGRRVKTQLFVDNEEEAFAKLFEFAKDYHSHSCYTDRAGMYEYIQDWYKCLDEDEQHIVKHLNVALEQLNEIGENLK